MVAAFSPLTHPDMGCPTCNGTDHHRASSKLCSFYKPRKKNEVRTTLKRKRDTDLPNDEIFILSTVVKSGQRSPLQVVIAHAARTLTCIAAEATRLFNMFVLDLLERKQQIPECSYNKFLHQPFQIIALAKASSPQLQTIHRTLYRQTSRYDVTYLSQLISNMAKDYETNCMNHVSTNIRKWAFKWYRMKMQKTYPDLKRDKIRILFNKEDDLNEHSLYLKACLMTYDVDITKEVSFDHWWTYFPLMWKFQRYFAKHGERNFSMVPITTYGIRHIRLDTNALYKLCLRVDLFTRKDVPAAEFRTNALVYWKTLFPDIAETSNKSFAYGVSTDGVACSYYYQKRYVRRRQSHNYYGFDDDGKYGAMNLEDGVSIVGVDPGRIDIFTAVDGNENVVRMSRKEFYSLTGMVASQKTRNRWLKNNPAVQSIVTQCPTPRTPDIENFRQHCQYVQQHLLTLVDFYGARRFTRQKLHTYIGKQKVWATIVRRITKNDRRTVVALGDAKFRHNSKGGPSTPLARMAKELKRRHRVRMIDEFRTSITCSHCDGELPKSTRHWQVKVCNDLCLTHWNRDVNAARNIRNIFLHMNENNGERPCCFARTVPQFNPGWNL